MVDVAVDDSRGLGAIGTLPKAQAVLRRLIGVLRPEELLERILHSPLQAALIKALPNLVGTTSVQLRPYVDAMLNWNDENAEWELDSHHALAAAYWQAVVLERITLRDYRRAWDEIRRAYRGFQSQEDSSFGDPNRTPTDEVLCGGPSEMAATSEVVENLVIELYSKMLVERLVPAVSSTPVQVDDYEKHTVYRVQKREGKQTKPANYTSHKPVPGIGFAKAVGNTISGYDRIGQMVLALARYASSGRNKKRLRQQKRAFENAVASYRRH